MARLDEDAPWALADAHRVLGDIHHAIGDTDAAQAAYEKCYALGWSPEPGQAMLLLEQGDANAAYASLERASSGKAGGPCSGKASCSPTWRWSRCMPADWTMPRR